MHETEDEAFGEHALSEPLAEPLTTEGQPIWILENLYPRKPGHRAAKKLAEGQLFHFKVIPVRCFAHWLAIPLISE